MRPIRLIMNAFGPYRGKVDLDFTKFDASSIYLISGPTGSGKTTIFDGISYALYNKASGGQRDVDMLKSQFSTDEDLCFVDFTFDLGGVTYRIKRNPTQRAPGTRGRPINYPSDVELFREDESIEQGAMNVDQAVESLLGITYDQFNQIVLLPQGEFRKLLLSSSKEKEEIFRNIFGTEAIQRFQTLLKEKTADLNNRYKEYGLLLNQSISGINAEADEALQEAIQHEDYDTILVYLNDTIEAGKKELEKMRKEITELNRVETKNNHVLNLLNEQNTYLKRKEELEEKSKVIVELKKALKQHEQASETVLEEDKLKSLKADGVELLEQLKANKESLLGVEARISEWTKKRVLSEKEEEQLDAIRQEVTALENEVKKFDELATIEKKMSQLNKTASDSKKEADAILEKEKTFEERLKDVRANLKNVPMWRKELENDQKELKKVEKTTEATTKEQEILEKILRLQGTLAKQLEENKTVQKKAEDSTRLYDEARAHYFGNLAGVLAAELEEEEPCPVCGSVHHPKPAMLDATAMTQEKLEEYEKAKDKENVQYTKVSQEMTHTGSLIEEAKESLEGSYSENYSKAVTELKAKVTDLETECLELENSIKKVNNLLKEESTWQEEVEKIQETMHKNELMITQLNSTKNASLTQADDLNDEMKNIQNELTYETAEEVLKERDAKNARVQQIQKEAASIRVELEKERDKEARLETSIAHLEKQLEKNDADSEKQADVFEKLMVQYELSKNFKETILNNVDKEKYENQIEKYKEDFSYTTRQLKKTEDELETLEEKRSIEEIKDQIQETASLKDVVELKREKVLRENGIHEKTYGEIKENLENSKEILEPLKVYKSLSEIANGTTDQTNKVSFERYVLSIYFSEILVAANQRFEKMTNGRFELVRKEEKAKHGAAAGLELNVFDRHSGKERPVKSLSGGETFKASLALALGLSDVIQSQQGGVRVDTLFVDEGFGTLDSESLEAAIETLMELQSTGRLIGIISHVDELKDRIPSKIVVTNKQEGSHARIEVE